MLFRSSFAGSKTVKDAAKTMITSDAGATGLDQVQQAVYQVARNAGSSEQEAFTLASNTGVDSNFKPLSQEEIDSLLKQYVAKPGAEEVQTAGDKTAGGASLKSSGDPSAPGVNVNTSANNLLSKADRDGYRIPAGTEYANGMK